MLVLTRKAQQQIQIGNNIVITILHVKGQAVRVGIEAPRDVRVIRSEINDKVVEPEQATDSAPAPVRRAKSRVPGGEIAPPKPFSSPDAEHGDRAGESHGLFPHLRRRSRQLGDGDGAPENYARAPGASWGLAAVRIG